MTTNTINERTSELSARGERIEKIIAELDAEAIAIEQQLEAGGGSAASEAVEAAIRGESDAADTSLVDDLSSRHRVICARIEEAHAKLIDAQRQVHQAQAEALDARAEQKRQEAATRQEKLAELLAAAVEFEECTFLPAVTTHGDDMPPSEQERLRVPNSARLWYDRIPRTQLLIAEAASLDAQAAAERAHATAIGRCGRGVATASTPEDLGARMPLGGPYPHVARAWARAVLAADSRAQRNPESIVIEMAYDGRRIDNARSDIRLAAPALWRLHSWKMLPRCRRAPLPALERVRLRWPRRYRAARR